MNNNLTCRRLSRMLGRRYTQLYNTRVSECVCVCARLFFIILVFIVVVVVYTVTRILTRITTKPPAQGDKQLPRRSSSPSSSTLPLPSPPRYNIIHTLALAYTHHAELLLLYIVVTRYIQYMYIRTSHGVFFIFQFFFLLSFSCGLCRHDRFLWETTRSYQSRCRCYTMTL